MEPHRFELRENTWWCTTEECVSEECTDYDRCNNGCVCNNSDPEDGD